MLLLLPLRSGGLMDCDNHDEGWMLPMFAAIKQTNIPPMALCSYSVGDPTLTPGFAHARL